MYKKPGQVFEMKEFGKLWNLRDELYRMKEDEIDELVKPISGGIQLRYFCEGVERWSDPKTTEQRKSYTRAIKAGLSCLFQHLQGCCMDCYEPTPSRIVKYDENGVPLSVEVDAKFKCGDMMAAMHFDHEEVPEDDGYIKPSYLIHHNKDVAKRQIECTNTRCCG